MANLRKMLMCLTGLFPLINFSWVPNPGLGRWLPPLVVLGWFTGAWGGTLSDPTLPSPVWLAAQPKQPGAAAMVEQNASSGMQLILIGRSRKLAVIDGRVVKPGDTYNGSTVLAIKPGEVVLQDASKSLKLTPNIEKKVITPPSLNKTGSTASSKGKKPVNGNGSNQ